MRLGYVPSYSLQDGIGKEIVKLYSGLACDYHYPTFLFYFLKNPGPLLLFDKIIVDDEAGKHAIQYAKDFNKTFGGKRDYETLVIAKLMPTEKEITTMETLLNSNLFQRVDVASSLTDKDYSVVQNGFCSDLSINKNDLPSIGLTENRLKLNQEFKKAFSFIEREYGPRYNIGMIPEYFESMNVNLTAVFLEKFCADPIDDVYRVPLYIYKFMEHTTDYKTAYDLVEQARQVLYLPAEPINDVDEFLAIHKEKNVRLFREKIHELTISKSKHNISGEIRKADNKLRSMSFSKYSIVIGFLGLCQASASLLSGNFASATIGTALGLMPIGNELVKRKNTKKYQWLKLVEGLFQE